MFDQQDARKLTALFKPRKWLLTIELINRLVLNKNVLVAVLAEQGGGKTQCLQLLLSGLDPSVTTQVLNAHRFADEIALLKRMAQDLDIPWQASLTVADMVATIQARNLPFLLVIDDAHHLPHAFLDDLLQQIKEGGERNCFHVCLFADPGLNERLQILDQGEYHNLIYSTEPGALSESETKTYVLKTVAALSTPTAHLSDDMIQAFYFHTGGVMARINQEKEHFFEIRTNPVMRLFWSMKRMIRNRLDAWYDWQDDLVSNSRNVLTKLHNTLSIHKRIPSAQGLVTSVLPSRPSRLREGVVAARRFFATDVRLFLRSEGREKRNSKPWFLSTELTASLGVVVASLIAVVFWQGSDVVPEQPLVVAAKPAAVAPQAIFKRRHVKKEIRLTSYLPALDEAAVRSFMQAAPFRTTTDDEVNLEKLAVVDSVLAIPKLSLIPSLAGQTLAIAAPPAKPAQTSHFTIQLLASQSETDIQRFVVKKHLVGKVQTRRLKRGDTMWYVLTMGDYSGRKQASEAIKRLPTHLGSLHPWVRPIGENTAIG